MKVAHQGVAVASLPGLAGAPALASAIPPAGNPMPPAPTGGQGTGNAPGVRPQPIDPGIDGWFLDRLFGRR